MAILAFVAKSFLVYISYCMAGNTGIRGIFKLIIDMTQITGHLFMSVFQLKIGFIMIKLIAGPGFRVMTIGTFIT